MSPELQQAVQEAYARRTGGAPMPQSGTAPQPTMQPQAPAPTPTPQQPIQQSSYSGGAEGIPAGSGVSIDSGHEIEMIAAKALAKRLNSAGKVA